MKITEEEYEKMLAWIDDPGTPPCGEDGWSPTAKELMTQLIPAYAMAQNMHTAKGLDDSKKILCFMLWVSESHNLLDPETYKVIRSFLNEHMELED